MEDFIKGKISDSALRDFAEEGETTERRSIIIELDLPPQAVARSEWRKAPWEKGSFLGSGKISPSDETEDCQKETEFMNKLEEKLDSFDLPEKPVRLDSAQAFVVSVTPEQLRTISQFPLTGLIRPNRAHRIPSY